MVFYSCLLSGLGKMTHFGSYIYKERKIHNYCTRTYVNCWYVVLKCAHDSVMIILLLLLLLLKLNHWTLPKILANNTSHFSHRVDQNSTPKGLSTLFTEELTTFGVCIFKYMWNDKYRSQRRHKGLVLNLNNTIL